MGRISQPQPVQLFCGAIFSPGTDIDSLKSLLAEEFGGIDLESEIFSFDQTDYYAEEMGENLEKIFFSFKEPVDPGSIVDVKLRTNELELRFSAGGGDVKRTVNLDPGYVSLSKMVLATTKDNYHRIYLRDGIYAEVTLKFTKKSFRPFDWTYPDYRTEGYIGFFNDLRAKYREKLRFLTE